MVRALVVLEHALVLLEVRGEHALRARRADVHANPRVLRLQVPLRDDRLAAGARLDRARAVEQSKEPEVARSRQELVERVVAAYAQARAALLWVLRRPLHVEPLFGRVLVGAARPVDLE